MYTLYIHTLYIYLSYTHYIYMYIPIIHTTIYIKIIHINALHTYIYIASMCNVRSLPLRIMRRVNMVCSRSDCSRKFLEKANDELGWLDIRSHPLGLPSDAIRVTFSKFCSLTFAQCLELQIHMQHLHIFCIYTHTYCTHLYGIYIYVHICVYTLS